VGEQESEKEREESISIQVSKNNIERKVVMKRGEEGCGCSAYSKSAFSMWVRTDPVQSPIWGKGGVQQRIRKRSDNKGEGQR